MFIDFYIERLTAIQSHTINIIYYNDTTMLIKLCNTNIHQIERQVVLYRTVRVSSKSDDSLSMLFL